MKQIPDHPEIRWIERTGYPSWYWRTGYYTSWYWRDDWDEQDLAEDPEEEDGDSDGDD